MVNDATYVAAIRSLWCDRCMVTVKQNIQDGAFTRQQNAVLFSDEPCRLSFRSVEVTNESDQGRSRPAPRSPSRTKAFFSTMSAAAWLRFIRCIRRSHCS